MSSQHIDGRKCFQVSSTGDCRHFLLSVHHCLQHTSMTQRVVLVRLRQLKLVRLYLLHYPLNYYEV